MAFTVAGRCFCLQICFNAERAFWDNSIQLDSAKTTYYILTRQKLCRRLVGIPQRRMHALEKVMHLFPLENRSHQSKWKIQMQLHFEMFVFIHC